MLDHLTGTGSEDDFRLARDPVMRQIVGERAMYPSQDPAHRRADMTVHAIALTVICIVGWMLLANAGGRMSAALYGATVIYVLCALVSNLASCAYHFAPWHEKRTLLRRIDHSAIYLSIVGTSTPLLVQAATTRTFIILGLCWILAILAIWNKITNPEIKSRWSTASYLAFGAIGLLALPDLKGVPSETSWFILAGSASYAIGTIFYSRKALPYRYAIWHSWVALGGMLMFFGIWLAVL